MVTLHGGQQVEGQSAVAASTIPQITSQMNMNLVSLLLLYEVIDAQMSLYQPQDSVTADIGATGVITCVSSENLETGTFVSWYKKSSNAPQIPETVKSCSTDKDRHKYGCENRDNKANLRIYNVQSDDAGVYYCSFHYVTVRKFGNGTTLITRERFTANSSIYLLAPPSPDNTMQIACVVTLAPSIIYVTWSLSGTQRKGKKMMYCKEINHSWTVLNLLSLRQHNWDYGDNVTCDALFSETSVQTQWRIKRTDSGCDWSFAQCTSYVRYVLILLVLLMFILVVHLSWTCQ
ncbi:immunoglobulin lambda-1 light chain-like [Hyperolius riggenbachi]|uniref:immunoglobulin lambda-1 light chain-like n=1 Tax=Hyperolius riggenbachi TaxID=752182 RepID=UPI0035A3787E